MANKFLSDEGVLKIYNKEDTFAAVLESHKGQGVLATYAEDRGMVGLGGPGNVVIRHRNGSIVTHLSSTGLNIFNEDEKTCRDWIHRRTSKRRAYQHLQSQRGVANLQCGRDVTEGVVAVLIHPKDM